MKSPCKNCTNRYPACHDKCQSYLEFVKINRENNELIRIAKEKSYKGYSTNKWEKKNENNNRNSR